MDAVLARATDGGRTLRLPRTTEAVDVPALLAAVRQLPELAVLDLTDVALGGGSGDGADGVVVALAGALRACPKLEELRLVCMRVDDRAAAALAAALAAHCPLLTELVLAVNGVGDAGAAALAGAVHALPRLARLDLRQNAVGDDGACALAAALHACPRLQTLCLDQNRIGDRGAHALSTALPGWPALAHLHLRQNAFGDATHRAIVAAVVERPGRDQVYVDVLEGGGPLLSKVVGTELKRMLKEDAQRRKQQAQAGRAAGKRRAPVQ